MVLPATRNSAVSTDVTKIDEAFRQATPLPCDVKKWGDVVDDAKQIPGVRLDTINLDLAGLRSSAFEILNLPAVDRKNRASEIKEILATALYIDRRLDHWYEVIPESWIPIRVSGDKCIAPSIRAAGLYQPHCDIYASLFLLSLLNKFRLSQINVKDTIDMCLSEQPSTSNLAYRQSVQSSIQQIVDDICASVPYYLGDRVEPGDRGDPRVQYPRAPGKPPIPDHYQTGPAQGGWSLLGPLGTLLRMKIKIREGQRIWIAMQMARTAKIYKIGKLPGNV